MPTAPGKRRQRSWATRKARAGQRQIGWGAGQYALELPGVGDQPVVIDFGALAEEVAAAVEEVVSRPFANRGFRPLKQSTIERKRRAGYSHPAQPMVATGSLERSFEVAATSTGIEIRCDESAFWQDRDRFRRVAQIAKLSSAIDRAIEKWLETF